jgi:dTDP-glucose 4,6-dehydratase
MSAAARHHVMTEVLVTGGAGFIGSNFVRYALDAHPDWRITTLDKLTYAGRIENLHDVLDDPRHRFVRADVCDESVVTPLVRRSEVVVHFAAETHVDRSLKNARDFVQTDVIGTLAMLEAARHAAALKRFLHISTDEVYGAVLEGASRETDELRPRNPYSASKAGADRLAYSYFATFRVPVVIARPSNNYGPYQFPEKVIPLFVTNALDGSKLPLYGSGEQIRDWLHVSDHCRALDLLLVRGAAGEVYNVGGGNEVRNIDLTHRILTQLDRPASLIERVADRPGHDARYSLDTTKLRQLGWSPAVPFEQGLSETVAWYRENEWWWRPIKDADPGFRAYYDSQYGAPR